LRPEDLPPIQVIVGPDENDGKGPWYFSLNNRRLWVLKRCREEELLKNNAIRVRVREAKSVNEEERYNLKNCVVEARFMREQQPSASSTHGVIEQQGTKNMKESNDSMNQHEAVMDEPHSDASSNKVDQQGNDSNGKYSLNHDKKCVDDSDDDDGMEKSSFYNPFCLVDDSSSSSSDE
jgi:hypothetical protein